MRSGSRSNPRISDRIDFARCKRPQRCSPFLTPPSHRLPSIARDRPMQQTFSHFDTFSVPPALQVERLCSVCSTQSPPVSWQTCFDTSPNSLFSGASMIDIQEQRNQSSDHISWPRKASTAYRSSFLTRWMPSDTLGERQRSSTVGVASLLSFEGASVGYKLSSFLSGTFSSFLLPLPTSFRPSLPYSFHLSQA